MPDCGFWLVCRHLYFCSRNNLLFFCLFFRDKFSYQFKFKDRERGQALVAQAGVQGQPDLQRTQDTEKANKTRKTKQTLETLH